MIKVIKKHKCIITIIIILIIIYTSFLRIRKLKEINKEYNITENENIIVDNTFIKSEEEIKETIKIDIKGQVKNPGVYELTKGTRIIDAINIAGGLTDIANTSLINLSKALEDQMVIIIYSEEEVLNSNVKEIETVFKVVEKECICPVIENDGCINTEIDKDSNKETSELININTASLEELMTLPNVGESKAKSIIEYRKENKFTTIEDVINVSGIGETLFEKIKAFITI